MFYALITFVAVDYIIGVMCGIADKKLSSETGFKGICRKIIILMKFLNSRFLILLLMSAVILTAAIWQRQT